MINGRKSKEIYEHIRKHGVVSKIELLEKKAA